MKIPYIFFATLVLFLICAGCSTPFWGVPDNRTASAPPVTTHEISPSPILATPPITTVATTTPVPLPTQDLESQGSLNKIYYYTVDGNQGFIPIEVYTGVNNYITALGPIYSGDDYNAVISNPIQRQYIMPMVNEINKSAKNPGDDARIAISLVQHIKYDANSINEIQVNTSKTGQEYIGRYPYTILFQEWGGICGEKSFLLALLLKELGYNVALIQFDFGPSLPGHMAVGIRAPAQYTYENTGYALIESTVPVIPSFDGYYLAGINQPMSSFAPAKVIPVSDGRSFDSIGAEYADAQKEQEIYTAWGNVVGAAIELNATTQQLNSLAATVNSWRSKAQNDYASGNIAGYNYDLQMYNQAYSQYQDYYTNTYSPAYNEYNNLNANFQAVYMPKESALEDKYGMNRGINVGFAV